MRPLRDTFSLGLMKDELQRDEGLVLHVYKDPGSGHAIGIGRNLDTQGISAAEREELGIEPQMLRPGGTITFKQALGLCDNDIADRAHQLDVYLPWWRLLSPPRQRVLLNMAFEMGTHGMLSKMADALVYLHNGDYEGCAARMAMTDWHKEVPKRAGRLEQMMRTDKPV